MRIIPVDERQRRHHLAASGLRPGQEKKRKNVADKRAAKKASVAVDLKQGFPATGSNPGTGEVRPMDVDVEAASVS